jgi:hypothetical protein
LDIWKTDKLYSQFYHPADHVYIENDGQEAQIPKHYAVLGFQNAAKMITVEALQERYPDLFTDTDYQGVEQVFMSPSSGGFDATSDLTAVLSVQLAKESDTCRLISISSASTNFCKYACCSCS